MNRPEQAAELALPRLSWSEVRAELTPAAERMAGLLDAVSRSGAPAVGVWSVEETAAHLSHVWGGLPMLARRDLAGAMRTMPASEGLGTPSGSVFPSIESLAPWTKRAVEAEPERDLARLSRIIQERAAEFQAEEHESDESPRPWIFDGVQGCPTLFACHVLNETFVHGDDIARASGLPWTVTPRAATLILRCFLFDVVCQVTSAGPVQDPPFRIDLRLVGQDRFTMVRDAAGMHLEQPSRRPVDVHLRADPASLLLLIWRRRGLPRLLAQGKLAAWGKRPWKIRELMKLTPSV